MKKIGFYILSLVILLSSFWAAADEDSEVASRARSRQYVGGADESDLKVQPSLNKDQKNKTEQADEGF